MMKKTWLLTLLLLVIVPAVKGDCDCTIAPFKPKPPCDTQCPFLLNALATSTNFELQLIIGLKEDVASKIVNWKGRGKAQTLNDYKGPLDDAEIKDVGKKLNSLNENRLEYFKKSEDDRAVIRNEFSNLFKNVGISLAFPVNERRSASP
jgi:hypothetical protein